MIFSAGFRKDNLPRGTWAFLCEGEILSCSCRAAFIENDGRLHQIEYIHHDDRS